MWKSLAYKAAALSIAVAALIAYKQPVPPPTAGALTLPSEDRTTSLVPRPEPRPVLEVGKKTKLFMGKDAYLFGAQSNPSSAALSRDKSFRIGIGKQIEQASGSMLTGEVSFVAGDQNSSDQSAQTRLSAAYLRQLNKHSDFRAGLSTDLASHRRNSTLELQFSMELADDLSLRLNHEASDGSGHEYQTDITVEKKF